MSAPDHFAAGRPTLRTSSHPAADKDAPSAEPALLAGLARELEKAHAADARFGPRIEMLWLACEQIGLPVPGVADVPARHELPPAAPVMIAYLVGALPASPRLAQAVRVAIFRYSETLLLIHDAEAARLRGAVAPVLLEQLRQKLYLLGHYYRDFQDDAVLRGLFPAPRVIERPTLGGPRPLASREDVAHRQQALAAVERVGTLARELAPTFERVGAVLAMIDGGPALKVADLLSPQARASRMLALTLPGRPDIVARLRDGLVAWERLAAALAAARANPHQASTAELEALGELVAPLTEFPLACRRDPLLRELVPPNAPAARTA